VIIKRAKKAYFGDRTVTNISKSFTHKMAAKTSWHRYGPKLRHCHPMYTCRRSIGLSAAIGLLATVDNGDGGTETPVAADTPMN